MLVSFAGTSRSARVIRVRARIGIRGCYRDNEQLEIVSEAVASGARCLGVHQHCEASDFFPRASQCDLSRTIAVIYTRTVKNISVFP